MANHFCHVLYDYPCDMDQGVENSESQPEFGSYDIGVAREPWSPHNFCNI